MCNPKPFESLKDQIREIDRLGRKLARNKHPEPKYPTLTEIELFNSIRTALQDRSQAN